jgi:hypothetical protein
MGRMNVCETNFPEGLTILGVPVATLDDIDRVNERLDTIIGLLSSLTKKTPSAKKPKKRQKR